MAGRFVPERGDLVWLQFSPQACHDQAGRRPAFVVSPRTYNKRVGLALFCPITRHVKGYPFEVIVDSGKIKGAILSDQVKSLDWNARKASRIARAPRAVVLETLGKIASLVGA